MISMVRFYRSVANVMNVFDQPESDDWMKQNATGHMMDAFLNAEGSERDEIEAARTYEMTMGYVKRKMNHGQSRTF